MDKEDIRNSKAAQKEDTADEAKNYRVWFDDSEGILFFKQYHSLTVDDVYEVIPLVQRLIEGKSRRLVMVDLTEGSTDMVDKDARRAFRETANPKDFDKIAIFGASAPMRMIAKVVLAITGVSKITQFFRTQEEAFKWLSKGGKNE